MIYGQNTRRRGGGIARVGMWLAALGGVLVGAVGCGGGGGGGGRTTPTPPPASALQVTSRVVPQNGWNVSTPAYEQPKKKWTFLVYLNAASNLEQYGTLNMNQMEQIGSNSNLNIAVQHKRIPARFIEDGPADDDASNGDWTDTRRYYVTRDNDSQIVNSQLISQRDDVDMGNWRELQEFVQWGIQTFPAERYCLVIWNHGAGWRSRTINPTRGLSYDDVTDNHIDTIEMPQAIDMGGGRKWDVLALDCSLMQMAEVAYEVRDKALYITGSEESPPGEGYPYHAFLGNLAIKLARGENPTGRDFALDIVQQTISNYGTESNITQSALDTSKLAALAPAVDRLGQVLNSKTQLRDQIRIARQRTESYDYFYYRDLRDFTNQLVGPADEKVVPIKDSDVTAAVTQVRSALDAAVIKNVKGKNHPRSYGLSIFLTDPYTFEDLDIAQANGFGQRYSSLSFAKAAPNWVEFLKNGPF